MNDHRFAGRRVLVVEDEFIIALNLCRSLEVNGAIVVGPLASIADAMDVMDAISPIDAAVLDVQLSEGNVFALAELLEEKDVPYIFTTALARNSLPERFRSAPICQKPVPDDDIINVLDAQLSRHMPS